MNKAADEPEIYVGENQARPGLVVIAIGSGTDPYSITPHHADQIARQLTDVATAVRRSQPHG